jgi:wyosine [tRNA(Phe)-imidazoG37] synthetase (radical SAM superfamily)
MPCVDSSPATSCRHCRHCQDIEQQAQQAPPKAVEPKVRKNSKEKQLKKQHSFEKKDGGWNEGMEPRDML